GGRIDPAAGFLVRELSFGVRDFDPALSRVDRAGHQPETSPVVGADRHHRMHQHAVAHAFATSPRPRRRSAVVRKLMSLVSWMAITCRPATAEAVCSLQPA